MITLRPYNEGTRKSTDVWDEFRIFAWTADNDWAEHCRGLVGVVKDGNVNVVDGEQQLAAKKQRTITQISMMEERCTEEVNLELLAHNLKQLGVYYGPAFQKFVTCPLKINSNT